MLFDSSKIFTKANLDAYLKELGKEYRKLNGTSIPAEIILVGGAAILTNYNFREMTTDVDAVIYASSSMNDAIRKVGNKFNLPVGWLNSEFVHTSSYSSKLIEVSEYYKTFFNVLQIRTVSAEYLIAMKLRSGRKYKNDLSDIIGILYEHQREHKYISLDRINKAIIALYGDLNSISIDSMTFLKDVLQEKDLNKLYHDYTQREHVSKNELIRFGEKYPNIVTQSNVNEILDSLKKAKGEK